MRRKSEWSLSTRTVTPTSPVGGKRWRAASGAGRRDLPCSKISHRAWSMAFSEAASWPGEQWETKLADGHAVQVSCSANWPKFERRVPGHADATTNRPSLDLHYRPLDFVPKACLGHQVPPSSASTGLAWRKRERTRAARSKATPPFVLGFTSAYISVTGPKLLSHSLRMDNSGRHLDQCEMIDQRELHPTLCLRIIVVRSKLPRLRDH